MAKKKVYAVKKGKMTGLFDTWEKCREAVHGCPGAEFKGFATEEEARAYLGCGADASETDGDSSGRKKGLKKEIEQGRKEEGLAAYVDGSFDQSKKAYSYGCILLYQGERTELSRAFQGGEDITMRNVAGELEGAMAAMDFCEKRNIRILHLYYDYQGIESWATGEWKRNKAGTIRYKNFYDSLKNVKVIFHKVKGHSGVELNEAVDRLAKAALGI